MPTRAEQKAATRARLLDAAAVLVAAKGVEGATVDAIAHEAGVTTGALYASFRTKAELLAALVAERQRDVSHIPLAELAADVGERWQQAREEDPIGARLLHELYAAAARDEALRELLAARLTEQVARLARRIEDEALPLRIAAPEAALLVQVIAAGMVSLQPVLGEQLQPALMTTAVALMRADR